MGYIYNAELIIVVSDLEPNCNYRSEALMQIWLKLPLSSYISFLSYNLDLDNFEHEKIIRYYCKSRH